MDRNIFFLNSKRSSDSHPTAFFKFMSVTLLSRKHTSHTKYTVPDLFMYIRTIQRLNYNRQKSRKQVAVYESDIPMTLKQGQGHKTWYELVDAKHSYNDAKFEKPRLNSVREKANDKVFVKSGNTSVVSLEYVGKSVILVCS